MMKIKDEREKRAGGTQGDTQTIVTAMTEAASVDQKDYFLYLSE